MNRALPLILALVALCPVLAPAQDHTHRRPNDIHQYLEHLDQSERDLYQRPAQVIEALRLRPGMAIADLGSGSGYFTRRFAEAVTVSGRVYAVDIEPEMLAYGKESLTRLQVPYNVEFILAGADDPKLPPQSVDLIFVCNTVHHLNNRATYFRNIQSALKPGGRVAIIDFYSDERSGPVNFPKRHLAPQETVITEMTEAGYRLERDHTFLPRQYFMEFTPVP